MALRVPTPIWMVIVGGCAIVAVATGNPGAISVVIGSVGVTFLFWLVGKAISLVRGERSHPGVSGKLHKSPARSNTAKISSNPSVVVKSKPNQNPALPSTTVRGTCPYCGKKILFAMSQLDAAVKCVHCYAQVLFSNSGKAYVISDSLATKSRLVKLERSRRRLWVLALLLILNVFFPIVSPYSRLKIDSVSTNETVSPEIEDIAARLAILERAGQEPMRLQPPTSPNLSQQLAAPVVATKEPSAPQSILRGKILAFTQDKMAEIDIGLNDGVTYGMTFLVSRNSIFIAELRIYRVAEKTSLGRLQLVQRQVLVGDDVRLDD